MRPSWLDGLPAWTTTLGLAIVATLLALGVEQLGILEPLELALYDAVAGRRSAAARASPEVTLVAITEADLARFGHPIDDATLALAIERVAAAGPAAIGVDLYRDRPVGAGGADLERIVRSDPRVVLVQRLPDATHPGVSPPAFLQGDAQVGFSDVALDADGAVRRGLLYLWTGPDDHAHVSLALQLAARRLARQGVAVGGDGESSDQVRIGATRLAPLGPEEGGYSHNDAGGYQLLLDFAGGRFPTYSAADLLDGRIPAELLRDRIVLLGIVAPSVNDLFATPLGLAHEGRPLAGLELHGHAADQLVRLGQGRARPLHGVPHGLEMAFVFALALLGAALGGRPWPPIALAVLALGGAAGVLALAVALLHEGAWLAFAPGAIAWMAAVGLAVAVASRRVRSERALLMEIFGRHVSAEVAGILWARRRELVRDGRLPPERRVVTVLMADLVGSTRASVSLSPEELLRWLDESLEMLARAAGAHGGIVEDYYGDGLMVDFGLPAAVSGAPDPAADARRAVQAALAMAAGAANLARHFSAEGRPPIRLRVGIATGSLVVGTLGSAERLKYTTVGAAVNTAARLESFEREEFARDPERQVARILIAESTRALFPEEELEVEDLGLHVLRGKGEPERIFRVQAMGRQRVGKENA